MTRFSQVFTLCLAATISGCAPSGEHLVNDPLTYLKTAYRTPEDYLVSCFDDHDIVFVGEHHYIKHDVELIQTMIPRLYEAGIRHLGMEFAGRLSQAKIDSLLSGREYDDSLAQAVLFEFWPFWGYREYCDIFRAAWRFNRTLGENLPPFRVVGLNAITDWSHMWTDEDRENPQVMAKVFADGDPDERMAATIIDEFIGKGHKALIYSGINHAYTRYRQPVVGPEGKVVRYVDSRLGNRIYDKIGDRCMTVFLHAPWPSREGYSQQVLPADGTVDSLMALMDPSQRRIGFDVAGTPMGTLPGASSYWSNGYPDFTLADYCDGYIYQRPLGEYEGVAVVDGFINEGNRLAVIAQMANPAVKDSGLTVKWLVDGQTQTADIRKRFAQLGK